MKKNKTAHAHPPAPHVPAAQTPEPAWHLPAGLLGRLVAGGIFLGSGLHKLSSPAEEFAVVLEAYQLIPETHTLLFASLVPWLELVAGLFLLTGFMTRAAGVTLAALSGSFFLALASTYARRIVLENCGCFGTAVHLKPWQAMILDVVLIGLCWLAMRYGSRRLSLDRWVEEGS